MGPAYRSARSYAAPILLVEDQGGIRRAMVDLLRHVEGYEVLTARNGAEALAELATTRPCAIVLDLTMPRMDGFAFRRAQLRRPSLRDIPTLAWSVDPSLRARAERLGMPFFRKVADLAPLLDAVRRHCRPRHLRVSAS